MAQASALERYCAGRERVLGGFWTHRNPAIAAEMMTDKLVTRPGRSDTTNDGAVESWIRDVLVARLGPRAAAEWLRRQADDLEARL